MKRVVATVAALALGTLLSVTYVARMRQREGLQTTAHVPPSRVIDEHRREAADAHTPSARDADSVAAPASGSGSRLASAEAALDWALRQPHHARLDAVTAVLISCADDPPRAVRLAQRCCHEDPSFVREHGATLITVLSAAGEFRTAATFAELGGPERAAWMRLAFREWAKAQPAAAGAAARVLNDDDALAGVAAATPPAWGN